VFVHGFNGKAAGTWIDFPRVLTAERACQGCDFVFYGYDGLYTEAYLSGTQLFKFIDALVTPPLTVLEKSLSPFPSRPNGFRFKKLTLVAHSLGAIVSRQALIEHYRNTRQWAEQIELVLFAPAHMGASLLPLLTEAFTGVAAMAAPLMSLLRFKFQVLRDLDPESKLLDKLKDDSERAILAGCSYMKAKKVLVTPKDRVVQNVRFLEDATPDIIEGATHSTICKPRADFSKPASELLKVLCPQI